MELVVFLCICRRNGSSGIDSSLSILDSHSTYTNYLKVFILQKKSELIGGQKKTNKQLVSFYNRLSDYIQINIIMYIYTF